MLRVATPFPINERSNRRSDPRLGYVLAGGVPDVDARGFRNRGVTLEDAEIVVIGDSHTFGNNVSADASFPAVLGRKTGRRVYNMGMGSYGIYHYMVLMDELATRPIQQVLLGFYPSNDLTMHCSVTELPSWSEYAASTGIRAPACEDEPDFRPERGQGVIPRVKRWSKENVALISALDYLVWERIKPLDEPAFHLPHAQAVSLRRAEEHALGASLDSQSAKQNYANSLRILERARENFERAGIRFSVLLIPSREMVLSEWSRRNGFADPGFEALVESQRALTRSYEEFLRDHGIPVRNALAAVASAFQEEIEAGRVFYPRQDDGHPFERGYEAYAAVAAELVAPRASDDADGR